MITHDKKYLTELFKFGQLKRVWLSEAPLVADRWEMAFDTRAGEVVYAETRRGEAKRFASLEAAKNYAADIGFNKMELNW